MRESSVQRNNAQTLEESLADESYHHIRAYLDYATESAAYAGPSDRPPEIHTRRHGVKMSRHVSAFRGERVCLEYDLTVHAT